MAFISSFLLLASAQVSAAAEPLPSEQYLFGDWVVTCDNGLRCQATAVVPDATPEELAEEQRIVGTPEAANAVDRWDRFGSLTLQRDGGGNTPLLMTLGNFEGTPARLVTGDTPLAARITGSQEDGWRIEPQDRNAFFDALYGGTILVQDRANRTLSEVSVNGLWEAMVYMDERQGRLRTPTALIRRGRRSASVVPTPLPIPVIQAARPTAERPLAIPARRLTEARRAVNCTQEQVGTVASTEAEVYALGNGRSLIMLACGGGAYNFNSTPLIAWQDGRTIRIEPARFDNVREPIDGEPDAQGYSVTGAEFDPATMTISEYAKGRGIGDCGVAATYVWDGEMFRMVQQREMSECRGSREMLTTWRAEVR